jgi:hypothetical protein
MPKSRRSARPIRCQYCGKGVNDVGALESHTTQKAECAERRRQDLRQFAAEVEKLRDSLDGSSNPSDSMPTPSSPLQNEPPGYQSVDADVIDVEMSDDQMSDIEPVEPPRNVTIEEVEDEDAPCRPVRRF